MLMKLRLSNLIRLATLLVCATAIVLSSHKAIAGDVTTIKNFVFAEATSQTLLRSGQIDFSTSIGLDDTVNAEMIAFDDALDQPNSKDDPRYALILDVFLSKSSRRVLNLKGITSSVFLGFQGAPFSVGLDDPARNAPGFAAHAANNAPQETYGAAPSTVGAPIIFSYQYDRAQIEARRQLGANLYLVDRVNRTYIRTTVDVSEKHRFEIPYRLSRHDPKRNQIVKSSDTEKDLDDYERQELLLNLSDILRNFQQKASEAMPFKTALALRKEISKSQTKVLADLEANRFDARPLNDPRFDSVVAIYTGKGALGSGFYVTPTVIMTNWHVVNGHRFVEMKNYDGLQTYGTVLGHDARLDIALVKVERRGRPVAFFTGRHLNPGSEVEAIGHPLRFEFSITRGVVSSVRKHYSINLPRGSGGEDVLFVQTDTPINPGNSGGPLFLGQKVVGMNTWGRTDGQNLGFSVHYSELLNFINEHLPGFKIDPTGRN